MYFEVITGTSSEGLTRACMLIVVFHILTLFSNRPQKYRNGNSLFRVSKCDLIFFHKYFGWILLRIKCIILNLPIESFDCKCNFSHCEKIPRLFMSTASQRNHHIYMIYPFIEYMDICGNCFLFSIKFQNIFCVGVEFIERHESLLES